MRLRGAYAVLADLAQEAVNGLDCLRPGDMANGFGLAETTPSPLITVTRDSLPFDFDIPQWTCLDWRAAALSLFAIVPIFSFSWNVLKTLGLLAIGGLILGYLR